MLLLCLCVCVASLILPAAHWSSWAQLRFTDFGWLPQVFYHMFFLLHLFCFPELFPKTSRKCMFLRGKVRPLFSHTPIYHNLPCSLFLLLLRLPFHSWCIFSLLFTLVCARGRTASTHYLTTSHYDFYDVAAFLSNTYTRIPLHIHMLLNECLKMQLFLLSTEPLPFYDSALFCLFRCGQLPTELFGSVFRFIFYPICCTFIGFYGFLTAVFLFFLNNCYFII